MKCRAPRWNLSISVGCFTTVKISTETMEIWAVSTVGAKVTAWILMLVFLAKPPQLDTQGPLTDTNTVLWICTNTTTLVGMNNFFITMLQPLTKIILEIRWLWLDANLGHFLRENFFRSERSDFNFTNAKSKNWSDWTLQLHFSNFFSNFIIFFDFSKFSKFLDFSKLFRIFKTFGFSIFL